jgi:hypothetical protein
MIMKLNNHSETRSNYVDLKEVVAVAWIADQPKIILRNGTCFTVEAEQVDAIGKLMEDPNGVSTPHGSFS